MPLILCLFCFVVIAITNSQKKKKQRIAAQPGIERRSLEALEYTLTWMIFQEVAQEIYAEWEKRGAPHPIGYYHRDFIALGQEMYDDLYPAQEALWRAKEYLKTLGIDRPFNCDKQYREEPLPKSLYHFKIGVFDFGGNNVPHCCYHDYPTIAEQHSHYMYKGKPIVALAKDDWRRIEYLASDGTRHHLKETASVGLNLGDW